MSNCVVATCKNYSRITKGTDIKYFRFPNNDDLAKQWIEACRREGTINLKNARICSVHFEASCFEVPLQQRLLGYIPINSRHLKPDAVPTLSISRISAAIEKKKHKELNRLSKRRQRDELVGVSKTSEVSRKTLGLAHDTSIQLMDVESQLPSEPRAMKNKKEIVRLRNKIKMLKEVNNKLRKKLDEAESKNASYEIILARVYTRNQIKTEELR